MQRFFIKLLLSWLVLSTVVITILNSSNYEGFIRILMAWFLIIFWIFVGGYLTYKNRDRIKKIFNFIPGIWTVKFFVFVLGLMLLEEAIATVATNLAPLFGLEIGQVFITASSNYLQVILHHSVVSFIPVLLAWVWILKKYNFSANQTFWLFGVTGFLIEAVTFGGVAEFGLWIPVYGLMIYLPAYCIPNDRGAKEVTLKHYFLVFIITLIFMLAFYAFFFLWNVIGLPSLPNFGRDFV